MMLRSARELLGVEESPSRMQMPRCYSGMSACSQRRYATRHASVYSYGA